MTATDKDHDDKNSVYGQITYEFLNQSGEFPIHLFAQVTTNLKISRTTEKFELSPAIHPSQILRTEQKKSMIRNENKKRIEES